jgi:hypothetical protein
MKMRWEGPCRMHERYEKCIVDNFEDLDVGGRISSEWMSEI